MFRDEPRTADQRIAALEEQMRRVTTTVTIQTSNGVANIITDEGDLIVGAAGGVAVRLGVGPSGTVLTSDPTAPDSLAWEETPSADDFDGLEALVWLGGLSGGPLT